jgi:hypothetical protein
LQKRNKTKLWQENVPKISVEQIKGNGNPTFIYTPWALSSRKKFILKKIYMWPMLTYLRWCAPMSELRLN